MMSIPGKHCDWGDVDGEIVRQRDAIIRSVIWSQGLSGIVCTWDETAQLCDEVMDEPVIELDCQP